ncbi:Hypothetical_protein [Hexamita inflata]|uniref:Hypothetical_protein n=1 Tax=Hexamita inflata TaxID=28002 RepID=A0AA86U1L1_9EUKA|nr:Hypothetical protein HINF_LOCUS26160 [Hexamita inflata]
MPPVRLPCWELGPPGTATAWCGWCWGLWLCARLKIWYGGCGGNGGVQMHQNIRGVLLFMCKWILKQFIFNAANQLPELLQLWSVNIQLCCVGCGKQFGWLDCFADQLLLVLLVKSGALQLAWFASYCCLCCYPKLSFILFKHFCKLECVVTWWAKIGIVLFLWIPGKA